MNNISQHTKITTTDINTLITECNGKLDLTSSQTISGQKTFTKLPVIHCHSPAIDLKEDTYTNGTLPLSNQYWIIQMKDKDGSMTGRLLHYVNTDGQTGTGIYTRTSDGASEYSISCVVKSDGIARGYAPSTPSSASSNEIATANFVKNNCVYKTGNESIAGLKTFTDGIKAINVTNQTVDSATLFSTNTGSIQHYWSSTDGGTKNITNLPSQMAFMLISYTYRYISETDYWIEQQLFQAGKPYRRTIRSGTVSGWTSMWIA